MDTTLLSQTLMLTLLGMGMTFAALGVLVLGMYAMTALIKDKPVAKEVLPEAASVIEPKPVEDQRPLVAAAAVAVALTEQAAPARYTAAAAAVAAAVATATPHRQFMPGNADSTWNAYVRGRTLALRNFYNARRQRAKNGN